jgi:hypothetical protein
VDIRLLHAQGHELSSVRPLVTTIHGENAQVGKLGRCQHVLVTCSAAFISAPTSDSQSKQCIRLNLVASLSAVEGVGRSGELHLPNVIPHVHIHTSIDHFSKHTSSIGSLMDSPDFDDPQIVVRTPPSLLFVDTYYTFEVHTDDASLPTGLIRKPASSASTQKSPPNSDHAEQLSERCASRLTRAQAGTCGSRSLTR